MPPASKRSLPSEIRRIAVIGAGAVGSFYGARLQHHGLDVQFFTRSGARTLSREKLHVTSVWGNFSIMASVFDDPARMDVADLVLVTVKALPEIDYQTLLAPVVGPGTVIFTLQNGIGADERIARAFPKNPVVGGLAFTCITRIAADQILHQDYGLVRVGWLREKDAPAAELAAACLDGAGIQVKYLGQLRPLRWQKLLWNIPFNCLSVVAGGATTDKLVDSEAMLLLVRALMRETQAVARAEGHEISDAMIEDNIAMTRKMTPYKTSMMLDWERGLPMEVDAILGEPLALAKKHKVPAPAMAAVYALLKFQDEVLRAR